MDEAALKELLAGLPMGSIRFYDRTGSTNTEAARWAEEGAPDLSLVVADEEAAGRGRGARRGVPGVVADERPAGRGRLGRSWYPPPGGALAFSLILRCVEQDVGQDGILPYEVILRLTALGTLAGW